jgi:hypothetical protein
MSTDPNSFFGSMFGRQEWQKIFSKLQHYLNVTAGQPRSNVHVTEEKAIIDLLKNNNITMEYLEEKRDKYTRLNKLIGINFYSQQDDNDGNKRGDYVPQRVADNILSLANTTDPVAGPKIRSLVKDAINTEIDYLKYSEEGKKGQERKVILENVLSKFIGAKRKVSKPMKGGMRTRKLRKKNKQTRRR